MNVGSICTRRVITTHPQLDVQAAAELMRQEHVGFLVVVPEQPRGPQPPLGVITDRDITTAVVAKRADPTALKVGDVMSIQPVLVGKRTRSTSRCAPCAKPASAASLSPTAAAKSWAYS